LLLDELPTPLEFVLIENGGLATAMRPRLDRTGLSAELKQSGDAGDVDAEASCDLATRALMIVDDRDDSFPEIVR
jgi:hypothetical protein